MGALMGQLVKQIAVSLICQKALKSFGKQDYADCVKLGGWCLYGVTIVQMYKWIMNNSALVDIFMKIGELF
ncbi:MAG: hypothetical protein RR891_10725 [Clostridium sp.]